MFIFFYLHTIKTGLINLVPSSLCEIKFLRTPKRVNSISHLQQQKLKNHLKKKEFLKLLYVFCFPFDDVSHFCCILIQNFTYFAVIYAIYII